jgi:hypothetical protein
VIVLTLCCSALDHPFLAELNKTLHAKKVLQELKTAGGAWWAKYKGNCEYMVWDTLPKAAIIQTLPLSRLVQLYDEDQDVAGLLHLQVFTKNRKTLTNATSLRDSNILLSIASAKAMAGTAKVFGLDSAKANLHHIEDFVARLVDGWSIASNATLEMHTHAVAFASALGSNIHHQRDVARAFVAGMQRGSDALAYFSRRRRPAKR